MDRGCHGNGQKNPLITTLHAIHPENVTPRLGDPVPPKARILEVWVLVLTTKSLVKNSGFLVCIWCVVVLGQSILT
jgi:hypothetical protein